MEEKISEIEDIPFDKNQIKENNKIKNKNE
jgi:hypothetical protein